MGFTKYRTEYPVVNQSPTLSMLLKNVDKSDLFWSGLAVLLSFPIGYSIPRIKRTPIMWTTVGLVSFGATCYCLQQSGKRFLGLSPNAKLVKKYPYRLDIKGYEVRTEPLRTVNIEESNEVRMTPRF